MLVEGPGRLDPRGAGAERRHEEAGLVEQAARAAVDGDARLEIRDGQPLEGVDRPAVPREVVVEAEHQAHQARPEAERRRCAGADRIARRGAGQRLALDLGEEARRQRQPGVQMPVERVTGEEPDGRRRRAGRATRPRRGQGAAQVGGGAPGRDEHHALRIGVRDRAGDGALEPRERGRAHQAGPSRRDHGPIVDRPVEELCRKCGSSEDVNSCCPRTRRRAAGSRLWVPPSLPASLEDSYGMAQTLCRSPRRPAPRLSGTQASPHNHASLRRDH